MHQLAIPVMLQTVLDVLKTTSVASVLTERLPTNQVSARPVLTLSRTASHAQQKASDHAVSVNHLTSSVLRLRARHAPSIIVFNVPRLTSALNVNKERLLTNQVSARPVLTLFRTATSAIRMA